MSAKKTEETERDDAAERPGDISEDCLKLMRFNYENLDRAVWKAHQFSWFMTSIFVPVIFGGLGYLLKELDKISVPGVVMGAIVVVGVTWYWYAFTRILARYNGRRFKQLERLEKLFDEYYLAGLEREDIQFIQYRVLSKRRSWRRFKYAALAFAIFLTVVAAAAAMWKMLLSLCQAMQAM